jgi:hypothetical protein
MKAILRDSRLVTRHFSSLGFCQKAAFLCLWGALSDERSGSAICQSQSLVICLYEH